jgi:hypothetical protein
MSIQVRGRRERSGVMVTLVALALAFGVFLLATQAASIWSSRGDARLERPPVHVATVLDTPAVNGSQIPAGCWVKYGCHRGEPTISTVASRGQVPDGCRIKFGC